MGLEVLTQSEKDRVIDYFESWELALWMRLPIEEVVDYFEDEIEDKLSDLNEFMGYKDEDSTEEGL